MADRVIWATGWTLLSAVVMALAAIVVLADTTTEQTVPEGNLAVGASTEENAVGASTEENVVIVECRPTDVMLGRADDCEGWPTGRAMPFLLLTAAVAALGVPDGRRRALTRLAASLGVVVAAMVVLSTFGRLAFTPRTWPTLLVWGVLVAGFLPFFLLPFALRHDVAHDVASDVSGDAAP